LAWQTPNTNWNGNSTGVQISDFNRIESNTQFLYDNTAAGAIPTSVTKNKGYVLDTGARSITITYNNDGTLATLTEKSGGTTVATATLNYSNSLINNVAITAGGNTATTTFTFTSGQLTGIAGSVA
jgi:hypothetical protein